MVNFYLKIIFSPLRVNEIKITLQIKKTLYNIRYTYTINIKTRQHIALMNINLVKC